MIEAGIALSQLTNARREDGIKHDPSGLLPIFAEFAINCTLTYFAEHFRRFSHDIEACQCRRARIQRNHIGCAILVWVRLKALAHQTGNTVYQIKHGMLSHVLLTETGVVRLSI